MSQPSEAHRYLDGPLFVEWLNERFPGLGEHPDQFLSRTDSRRLFDYERGSHPYAYMVPDRICVALGVHLDEIPDRVWRKAPPKKRRRTRNTTPAERRRALEMLRERKTGEVARLLGVSKRTVENWRRAAA